MLSRVADALFWMSRYLTRAEHVARLADVAFHVELDLSGIVEGEYDRHWLAVAGVLNQTGAPEKLAEGTYLRWLCADHSNPKGVLSCVSRSRANARSVRGNLPHEVWKELNTLYLQLMEPGFASRAAENPTEMAAVVEAGSHAVQGACDALMAHDAGWYFLQLGKYLERADLAVRTVDVHHELLREETDQADLPLVHLHWAAALRGCAAYHAYQRLHVGRVEPARVIELLLGNPAVPRSARFCLDAASNVLADMARSEARRDEAPAQRLLGRALSDLRYVDLRALIGTPELHPFLMDLGHRCAEASLAVQQQYSG